MVAMRAVGIVPARWASSRFPGKALVPIAGVPMIQRVWERAREAKSLRDVVVATDDERIAALCRSFGAPVTMTRADHPSGTDRLGEVAAGLDDEIVVNVQGDEPLIAGFVIDAVVEALREDPGAHMATAVHAASERELRDPNRTKAVVDEAGRAVAFSRALPGGGLRALQHVGIYAYRRGFLLEFVDLPQTANEQVEQLEQLRALDHGFAIRAARVEGWRSVPVDVPADVALVEAALAARTGDAEQGAPRR